MGRVCHPTILADAEEGTSYSSKQDALRFKHILVFTTYIYCDGTYQRPYKSAAD